VTFVEAAYEWGCHLWIDWETSNPVQPSRTLLMRVNTEANLRKITEYMESKLDISHIEIVDIEAYYRITLGGQVPTLKWLLINNIHAFTNIIKGIQEQFASIKWKESHPDS
jgi:hypothetical protein